MNTLIEYTKWLLKWLGIALLSLIIFAGVIGGGIWGWQWWSHDRHAANVEIVVRHKNQWSKLARTQSSTADTNTDPLCSSDTHPVFVGIVNNSSKTIEYVWIKISAHLPRHSTNVLKYNAQATSDRIVAPGEGFGHCWVFEFDTKYANNSETENAIYEGTLYSVRFKD